MRLTENQAAIIRLAVKKAFGTSAQAWLLNYCMDSSRRDEAINLFIHPDPSVTNNLSYRKNSLLNQLEQTFCQQKIEIAVEGCDQEGTYLPVHFAHKTGIRL